MSSIHDFVSALHQSHLDNGRMVYYAAMATHEKRNDDIEPVMPVTPFIFEYFLYNSIYQHDWIFSDTSGQLATHGQDGRRPGREGEQQEKLINEYLKPCCDQRPELLKKAFAPFAHLVDLDGEWTKIIPDSKLDAKSGENFFNSVRNIQNMASSGISSDVVPHIFQDINTCREFVGKVRNNIFHGAKKLRDIWDIRQRQRIELYHLFIQSLNSLFFLTRGMENVASDEVFSPILIPTRNANPLVISSMKVLELFVEGMMKREDANLISWANECLKPLRNEEEPSGALFYPSAGGDIITPVLLGLPFCKEFHFYDNGGARDWARAMRHLAKLLDFTLPRHLERSFETRFEYGGVKRRIFHTRADNQDFLNTSSRLVFFFRRGDSNGDGGSDQRWESDLFTQWKPMIPGGELCAILTDGIPGGLADELKRKLGEPKKFPSSQRKFPYYCGIIRS
jgi:hypothetical protein